MAGLTMKKKHYILTNLNIQQASLPAMNIPPWAVAPPLLLDPNEKRVVLSETYEYKGILDKHGMRVDID